MRSVFILDNDQFGLTTLLQNYDFCRLISFSICFILLSCACTVTIFRRENSWFLVKNGSIFWCFQPSRMSGFKIVLLYSDSFDKIRFLLVLDEIIRSWCFLLYLVIFSSFRSPAHAVIKFSLFEIISVGTSIILVV